MGTALRETSGALLVAGAIALLVYAVAQLRDHDYVATALLSVVGLSVLRAGAELLRPTLGE